MQEIIYKSKEQKDSFEYPNTYKCDKCSSLMDRVAGNSFYKFAYKCRNKKCHCHDELLYGRMRNSLDIEELPKNHDFVIKEV